MTKQNHSESPVSTHENGGQAETAAVVRTQRAIQILRQLQTGQTWSAVELAEQFRCSTRTIFRDFHLLKACGISVEKPPGEQGFRLTYDFFWQPVRPTLEEMMALVLGARLAADLLPPELAKQLESGLAKLVGSERPVVRRRLANLTTRIDSPHHTQRPFLPDGEFLPLLLDRIGRQQPTRLWLAAETGGEPDGEVVLTPIRLTATKEAWHLVATHEDGAAQVLIPLSRIRKVEPASLDEPEPNDSDQDSEADAPSPPELKAGGERTAQAG